jgi:hypothetical protein
VSRQRAYSLTSRGSPLTFGCRLCRRSTPSSSRPTAASRRAALGFAVQSLVPATLSWLRVYRHAEPDLFGAWH